VGVKEKKRTQEAEHPMRGCLPPVFLGRRNTGILGVREP